MLAEFRIKRHLANDTFSATASVYLASCTWLLKIRSKVGWRRLCKIYFSPGFPSTSLHLGRQAPFNFGHFNQRTNQSIGRCVTLHWSESCLGFELGLTLVSQLIRKIVASVLKDPTSFPPPPSPSPPGNKTMKILECKARPESHRPGTLCPTAPEPLPSPSTQSSSSSTSWTCRWGCIAPLSGSPPCPRSPSLCGFGLSWRKTGPCKFYRRK